MHMIYLLSMAMKVHIVFLLNMSAAFDGRDYAQLGERSKILSHCINTPGIK